MAQDNLPETLLEMIEMLDANLPIEDVLRQVGRKMNDWIPNEYMVFNFIAFGLNYRLGKKDLLKTNISNALSLLSDQDSALGWVLTHNKPIKRGNISQRADFARDSLLIRQGIESQLIVPLNVQEENLGVLNFVNDQPDFYTDQHLQWALAFARLIASKVNQIYVQKEMQGIAEISRSIQMERDLDSMLMLILEHIQALGYDRIRVYLYDEETRFLQGTVQLGHGLDINFGKTRWSIEQDVYSQKTFANDRASIHMPKPEDINVYYGINKTFLKEPHHAWADLPLYFFENDKKRIVGKISVDNVMSGYPLDRGRLDRLMDYASQAANAIWKAQAFERMRHEINKQTQQLMEENKRQRALAKIGQAVHKMTCAGDLEEVACVFLEAIKDMEIDAQAVAVHRVIDSERCTIQTIRVLEPKQVIFSNIRGSFALTKFWKDERVQSVSDIYTLGEDDVFSYREKFGNLSIASFVDLPFSLGVLSVFSTRKHAFSDVHLQMLRGVAEIFSVGIKRFEDFERVEAQYEEIKENEGRYRNLIRLVGGVSYVWSWKSREYLYVDNHIESLIGCPANQFTAELFDELIEEEVFVSKGGTIPIDIHIAGEGQIPTLYKAEYILRLENGTRLRLADFAIEFCDESGQKKYSMGVLQDITARHTLEEALRQSQKMDAVGQLAGGIAHDFNNLLTGILGTTSLLLSQLKEQDAIRDDIEFIQNAGIKAADLTEHLLSFSRKQMIEPQILNINVVVSEIQKILGRLIREDIDLVISQASITKPVRIDKAQLDQVLINLVVNAKDAMPNGGKITIRTNQVTIDEGLAMHMDGIKPGIYATIEVVDTGIGMNAEMQGRIFEPFFTTKEKGYGTGLGLATVYGIVAQNEGHINVESVLGEGTAFKVFLPQLEQVALENVDEVLEDRSVSLSQETILVVEDDQIVGKVVMRTLKELGYQVLLADNVREALNLWEKEQDSIDLLLTDLVMPGQSGKELYDILRRERPDLPVIFMSGYSEEVVGDAFQHEKLLKKPFIPDELARSVRAKINESQSE